MKSALIGLGRMGLRHLDNLLALQLDIVGLGDPLREARTMAREKSRIPNEALFADPYKLIKCCRPELLLISTTAPAHADLTCKAAESGVKLILCEKPMATSIADARRMIDACSQHGSLLAINHPMRFMEIYSHPRALLASSAYGGLRSVHIAGGNFGLAMNASHYLEMFRYMTGETPDSVQAWFSDEKVPNPRGEQFEDRAGSLRITTPGGVRLTLDASSDQGHGLCVNYTARHGQIHINELTGQMNWTLRQEKFRDLPTTRYGMPSEDGALQLVPADAVKPSLGVLQALIAGDNYPTGEQGLSVIRALAAAHVSAEEGGRVVRLDEPLPENRVFQWA